MATTVNIPVAVRVYGTLTPDQVAAVQRAVTDTVAGRVAKAGLMVGTGPGGPAPTPAAQPLHLRLFKEAKDHLRPRSSHDETLLLRVVLCYVDTVTYQAFEASLRREGLDTYWFTQVRGPRPAPAPGLGADTIRMIYGPGTEEPEYYRPLGYEDRRWPIKVVADRTRLLLRDRTIVIEGVGDQADRHVTVPDNRWEMTPAALHAYLEEMVGGRLTFFEESLVAQWNEVKPQPVFDGPRVVAYYLVSGGSGERHHRIHDPFGQVVAEWTSEAALINDGLGLIDYLLLARGVLQLGTLAARATAAMAARVAGSAAGRLVRAPLLALALSARRLGRPLSAAMEGLDTGLNLPRIGARAVAGEAAPAIRAAVVAPAPRAAVPVAGLADEAAELAPAPVVTPARVAPRAPAAPAAPDLSLPRSVGQSLGVTATTLPSDDDFRGTFDETPSDVTIAPGQGVVSVAPEVALGFTPAQRTALRRLLGQSLSQSAIRRLEQLWTASARAGDAAILTAANSRELFDLHRNRFWRRVRNDAAAAQLFLDAGCQFAGGAPYLMINGQRVSITIDHIVERQTAPQLALTGSNLRLSLTRENTVVLRQLHDQDAFQRPPTPPAPAPQGPAQ
jgi:hypothetical protein